LNTSSLTQVVTVNTGGSGLTTAEHNQLFAIPTTSSGSGGTTKVSVGRIGYRG